MAILHLICGLPGSGKSTLALQLEQQTGAVRFTPDEWMLQIVGDGFNDPARDAIETIQADLAFRLLTAGLDVILENGFWTRAERDAYRRRATACGAEMALYFLDVERDILKARVTARNVHAPAGFVIPPGHIDLWAAQFESPATDEHPITSA